MQEIKRYGQVTGTEPREVVLLRTGGCSWGKCTFCDYHDDRSNNTRDNVRLNHRVLAQIQGWSTLQVICSASFSELPAPTMLSILELAQTRNIQKVVFEGHWMYRHDTDIIRDVFNSAQITTKFIIGAETFDRAYREQFLNKGMLGVMPEDIANHFDWVNIMYGMPGQSLQQLQTDITIGLRLFERVTVNMFVNNCRKIRRRQQLVDELYESEFYKQLADEPRIEILDDADSRAYHTLGGVGSKIDDNLMEAAKGGLQYGA